MKSFKDIADAAENRTLAQPREMKADPVLAQRIRAVLGRAMAPPDTPREYPGWFARLIGKRKVGACATEKTQTTQATLPAQPDQIDQMATEVLLNLKHRSPGVRDKYVKIAGRRKIAAAVPSLIETAENPGELVYVRCNALRALEEIGPGAVSVLHRVKAIQGRAGDNDAVKGIASHVAALISAQNSESQE